MAPVLSGWLVAFLLTQAVEAPIYGLALRGRAPVPRLLLALGASALTHPVVWAWVVALGAGRYWAAVAGAELFAVSLESGYLWRLGVPAPAAWALAANGASFALGLGLSAGGWW